MNARLALTSLAFALSLGLALPALAAVEAKVADTSGGRVVLELSAEPAFAVGDTVELTYQAGFMDMLLGSYSVRDRQGNRLILSTLSTGNPPSRSPCCCRYTAMPASNWRP